MKSNFIRPRQDAYVSSKYIFSLLRVSQWLKAIFVFIGMVYACRFDAWSQVFLAAFSFCLVSSSVYIYNDLHDLEEDRQHPIKSQRPLAHSDISVGFALNALFVLLVAGVYLAFLVSNELVLILSTYLVINLIYNQWARHIPMLDAFCIASGFMLRILAGTVGIHVPCTWWLVITATLLCLFIAFCKRRLEMQLAFTQRAVLKKYTFKTLDQLIIGTAISTFVCYVLYTIFQRSENYYFSLTIPFVAFGLFRYISIAKKSKNDDPLMVLLKDIWLCADAVIFLILTGLALYYS